MNGIKIFSENTHWTAVHNLAFDVVMPRVSGAAWKVLCFFIRQTKGYKRNAFSASYSDIMAGTGIKSRETISSALQELLVLDADGNRTAGSLLVRRAGAKPKDATRYALNRHYTVDLADARQQNQPFCGSDSELAPENENSDSEPMSGTDSEPQNSPPIRNAGDHYQRTTKEIIAPTEQDTREDSPIENDSSSLPSPSKKKPFDKSYMTAIVTAVVAACKIKATRMSSKMRRRVETVSRAFARDNVPVADIALAGALWPMTLAPVPEQLLDRFDALLALIPTSQSNSNEASTRHDTPFIHSPKPAFRTIADRRSEKWDDWLGEPGAGIQNYGALGCCG